MKISAQEGYGLRILLTLAKSEEENGLTINQISDIQEMSQHNVAKIIRLLRINDFVESTRGQSGGYFLKVPPSEILLSEVLQKLGGRLFDESDDSDISMNKLCTGSVDCSIRSLWCILQSSIDQVLSKMTLNDLLLSGDELRDIVIQRLNEKTLV